MRKTFIGAAVIFMCLFMLTGCYFGKTLEERIGARQIEKLEETLKNQSEIQNDFKDVKVEIKENHITYKFYYAIYIDDLTYLGMKSGLLTSDYSEQIDKYKDEIEKRYKIRPSIVTLEFYTSDGRKIGKIEG
jgi:hypothetical protein